MVKILIEKSHYIILISGLSILAVAIVFTGLKDVGIIKPHFDFKRVKYWFNGTDYYDRNHGLNINVKSKFENYAKGYKNNDGFIIDTCNQVKDGYAKYHFNIKPYCIELGIDID